MVLITEQLVRKRAEHNELEISSLEEVSLHQQDIEKIEYLDKWCRELRILYLQSNLIEKIENVSRLKKLEYLNLALNNVEVIENLEGCESLEKLDLTVNFVGELTSIETLNGLESFRELYLTGNPCTDYEGYREYVIATLPKLERLDGVEVEKSERIQAIQNLPSLKNSITKQQKVYFLQREKERLEEKMKKEQKSKPGFDGRWYTDIDNSNPQANNSGSKTGDKENDAFWKEKVAYTPESRKEVHEHMQKTRERDEKRDPEEEKPKRRYFFDDGRAMNVNEPKCDFELHDDELNGLYTLDIAAFKHMDTSLMDADVHPFHVRVVLKGKIFQLALDEEVNPDKSTAQRSQTTGHLVIKMPKCIFTIQSKQNIPTPKSTATEKGDSRTINGKAREMLEVDPSKNSGPDFGNIVSEKKTVPLLGYKKGKALERENSPGFVDDPNVPPLI